MHKNSFFFRIISVFLVFAFASGNIAYGQAEYKTSNIRQLRGAENGRTATVEDTIAGPASPKETVLVTGGAGYIGSHTVRELLWRGHDVVVIDSLVKGRRFAIRENKKLARSRGRKFVFKKGDLGNERFVRSVFNKYKIDSVIHFAAFIEVGESVHQPELYYYNNIVNTLHLLDAMKRSRVKKIVFSSSAAVYGNPSEIPITEDADLNPISPYGYTKLAMERLIEHYHEKYGIEWTALRYFNASGASSDGVLGEAHSPESHLIPITIDKLSSGQPMKAYGADYNTEDGTAMRDYINVEDLAMAHIAALAISSNRAYNLGSGEGYSVREIIEEAAEVLGTDPNWYDAGRRAGDPAKLLASSEAFQQDAGWEPASSNINTIIESAALWFHNRPSEAKKNKPLPRVKREKVLTQVTEEVMANKVIPSELKFNILDSLNRDAGRATVVASLAKAGLGGLLKGYENMPADEQDILLDNIERILEKGPIASGLLDLNKYLRDLDNDDSPACRELKIFYRDQWEDWRLRFQTAVRKFKAIYPNTSVAVISRAPGRITANEHTDYNDADSLGMPTRQDAIVISGINLERRHLELKNMEPKTFMPATFEMKKLHEYQIRKREKKSEVPWTEFALVVYQAMATKARSYGVTELPGLNVLVDGRGEYGGIPIESNISSSAGFEEALIYATEALLGIRDEMTGGEVIEIGRQAEAAIGFPCGKLDQGSSTVGRIKVAPDRFVGASIDCVPRLDEQGRDKTIVEPFDIPHDLEAILVDTGPKGDAQREYNIRVMEGELGSWLLAQNLHKLSPAFADMPIPTFANKVAELFGDINPDHNGKPYLYDQHRTYPVFLKPVFFSSAVLNALGIDVTEEQVEAWVRSVLPRKEIPCSELFSEDNIDKAFFANAARDSMAVGIEVEEIKYDMLGTVLHAIGDHERAQKIKKVLKTAVEAVLPAARMAALQRFGNLQYEGYLSLRDNYRNSSANIDKLADWAKNKEWCLAPGSTRHFGAGWGGWKEFWIKPGMYEQAKAEIEEYLSGQDWYQRIAADSGRDMPEQLKRGIMPYKPGKPASLISGHNGNGRSIKAAAAARTATANTDSYDIAMPDHVASLRDEMDGVVTLFTQAVPASVRNNRKYTIQYDTARLTENQNVILSEYIEMLKDVSENRESIQVAPFSSEEAASRQGEPLITITCKGGLHNKSSSIDVEITEGTIDQYLLRVPAMVNMIFTAVNLPQLNEGNISNYDFEIDFIKSQHKIATGRKLILPLFENEINEFFENIILSLPPALKILEDIIRRYEMTVIEALRSV